MAPISASQKMAPISASQKMAPISASQKMAPILSSHQAATIAPTAGVITSQKTPLAAEPVPVADPASASMDDSEYEGGGATLFGNEGSFGISPGGTMPAQTRNNANIELVGQPLGNSGYKIDKKLGEGGMGAVYKAIHPEAKALAIKVLHSEFTSEPKVLERFFNEAKAVNKIAQPHIVDISDFGFLATGQPYIAMEFLEGFDLAGRIQQQSPLLEAEALDIAIQVLEALYAAHSVNIIHRDMKPENIFLLKNKKQPDKWFVKVLDFGIAKLSQSNSQQTQSGTILGTPRYMSPEQARGEREIGPGADLYSLGIILYELVTGRAPFDEASYLGYLVAHTRKVPPQPKEYAPNITDDTNRIIMRCLEKTAEKRFVTAKEMRDELIATLQKMGGNVPVRLATPMGQFPVAQDPSKNQTFMLTEQAAPAEPTKPKAPEAKAPQATAIVPTKPSEPPAQHNEASAIAASGSAKTIGLFVGGVVLLAVILFFLFNR
jgi:eukaryotic-like serine/threonine-protein kinase